MSLITGISFIEKFETQIWFVSINKGDINVMKGGGTHMVARIVLVHDIYKVLNLVRASSEGVLANVKVNGDISLSIVELYLVVAFLPKVG